ncbi:MAG: hypothetical protein WKF46_00870 [Candidatus Limnocylindrales bacterium]|jgi:hypothetical protein|nr:hypothetical protein [Chloroflexota bacterium]
MIIPVVAIAGTAFVSAILGLRVVGLPLLSMEAGVVAILGVAILCGLYRPTLAMLPAAGLAAVAGVAAAWLVVLSVDPRDAGENILISWFLMGVMTAGAAAAGRLVAAPTARQRKPSASR